MDLNSVNITATQVAKNYFSAYVENGFIYSYMDVATNLLKFPLFA